MCGSPVVRQARSVDHFAQGLGVVSLELTRHFSVPPHSPLHLCSTFALSVSPLRVYALVCVSYCAAAATQAFSQESQSCVGHGNYQSRDFDTCVNASLRPCHPTYPRSAKLPHSRMTMLYNGHSWACKSSMGLASLVSVNLTAEGTSVAADVDYAVCARTALHHPLATPHCFICAFLYAFLFLLCRVHCDLYLCYTGAHSDADARRRQGQARLQGRPRRAVPRPHQRRQRHPRMATGELCPVDPPRGYPGREATRRRGRRGEPRVAGRPGRDRPRERRPRPRWRKVPPRQLRGACACGVGARDEGHPAHSEGPAASDLGEQPKRRTHSPRARDCIRAFVSPTPWRCALCVCGWWCR